MRPTAADGDETVTTYYVTETVTLGRYIEADSEAEAIEKAKQQPCDRYDEIDTRTESKWAAEPA